MLCMWDLKFKQMDEQYSLIWELMLYEFEQNYNPMKATKNFCCMKGGGPVDHCAVTRLFKKFYSSYKNQGQGGLKLWISRP